MEEEADMGLKKSLGEHAKYVLALGLVLTMVCVSSCGGKTETASYEPQNSMYSLSDVVWQDDFNGRSLNMNDWNYEYHEPGWVNNELQKYVDSKKNIYVKNGTLVIQAIKTERNGQVSYTSGRVNTQNKHDFKYGRFEARLKVPRGQGFLPAFWMMPTQENLYGQWPKCGEIDIMEVLGNKTDTEYGTIHFGEPHAEHQGTYTKFGEDFSEDFHIYACEWDPGEIRFYIDDVMFYHTSDWFTKKQGFGEITYPAPFDQPFYMILNVAVGGNWPGNPDPDMEFKENAQMVIDYVRVYQKPSYDENVSKPEASAVVLREPDASGNYVANSTFSLAEKLDDSKDWSFLLFGTGKGSASISKNELHIVSETAGDLDYSVQVVQPNIPLEKGAGYHYQFDAYADEPRTIITAITAPNAGWVRYLPDTKLDVTTKKQTYEFDFVMKDATDPTGRIEFNLGNQNATATVHISNVRFERTAEASGDDSLNILPDGNYVFNGQFQEGKDRMEHWTVDANDSTLVGVTNVNNVREFCTKTPVTLSQNVDVRGGKEYVVMFDAYSESSAEVKVRVSDGAFVESFSQTISANKSSYKLPFVTGTKVHGANLSISIIPSGTTYIDNVRLQENSMVVNGDFSSGLTGYSVYAHDEATLDYAVDSLSEDDALCVNIRDTGSSDWMIQLKQENITLEKGKTYHIAFDAKSSLARDIMYALQRDGSNDDNWIPYSGSQIISVAENFAHYETTFTMENETDSATILSISMGAVNGKRIKDAHTVTLDNIVIEEVK